MFQHQKTGTTGKMHYVVLEKAKKVRVKPYMRGGRIVGEYLRYDPRTVREEPAEYGTEERIHKFELAGLGKYPFRLFDIEEKVFKPHPDADAKPGGTCHYCGTGIRYCYWLESADGKKFYVGSECIMKHGDEGLKKKVSEAEKKKRREKAVAQEKELDKKLATILEKYGSKLSELPHPDERFKDKTMYDYVDFYLRNAGLKGKKEIFKFLKTTLGNMGVSGEQVDETALERFKQKQEEEKQTAIEADKQRWAEQERKNNEAKTRLAPLAEILRNQSGSWASSIATELHNGKPLENFPQKAVDIMADIYAKQFGRRGSKEYNKAYDEFDDRFMAPQIDEPVRKSFVKTEDIEKHIIMESNLNKARVQVKPYQRKGHLVTGYSQKRQDRGWDLDTYKQNISILMNMIAKEPADVQLLKENARDMANEYIEKYVKMGGNKSSAQAEIEMLALAVLKEKSKKTSENLVLPERPLLPKPTSWKEMNITYEGTGFTKEEEKQSKEAEENAFTMMADLAQLHSLNLDFHGHLRIRAGRSGHTHADAVYFEGKSLIEFRYGATYSLPHEFGHYLFTEIMGQNIVLDAVNEIKKTPEHLALMNSPLVKKKPSFRMYLNEPSEIWARAYEQWVYNRLPDCALKKALDEKRKGREMYQFMESLPQVMFLVESVINRNVDVIKKALLKYVIIEKAQIRVKPYQRKGHLVTGYSQRRKSKKLAEKRDREWDERWDEIEEFTDKVGEEPAGYEALAGWANERVRDSKFYVNSYIADNAPASKVKAMIRRRHNSLDTPAGKEVWDYYLSEKERVKVGEQQSGYRKKRGRRELSSLEMEALNKLKEIHKGRYRLATGLGGQLLVDFLMPGGSFRGGSFAVGKGYETYIINPDGSYEKLGQNVGEEQSGYGKASELMSKLQDIERKEASAIRKRGNYTEETKVYPYTASVIAMLNDLENAKTKKQVNDVTSNIDSFMKKGIGWEIKDVPEATPVLNEFYEYAMGKRKKYVNVPYDVSPLDEMIEKYKNEGDWTGRKELIGYLEDLRRMFTDNWEIGLEEMSQFPTLSQEVNNWTGFIKRKAKKGWWMLNEVNFDEMIKTIKASRGKEKV